MINIVSAIGVCSEAGERSCTLAARLDALCRTHLQQVNLTISQICCCDLDSGK